MLGLLDLTASDRKAFAPSGPGSWGGYRLRHSRQPRQRDCDPRCISSDISDTSVTQEKAHSMGYGIRWSSLGSHGQALHPRKRRRPQTDPRLVGEIRRLRALSTRTSAREAPRPSRPGLPSETRLFPASPPWAASSPVPPTGGASFPRVSKAAEGDSSFAGTSSPGSPRRSRPSPWGCWSATRSSASETACAV
jgi:hypothetical protein